MDLCLLPRSFNVQSTTLSCSFWTSACFPAALTSNSPRFLAHFGLLPCFPTASTSNPPRFLAHFGLLPCLPQLQRPIHHGSLLLLDFCHASRSFNVQSTTLSCSFWTSACFPAALTSNSPRFLAHFGLLPCFPTASTSNPPRFLAPFGLLPASPQLQRPIHHAFLLLLDFCLLPRSFDVQSTTRPIHHTSNPPRIQSTTYPIHACLPTSYPQRKKATPAHQCQHCFISFNSL